MKLAQCASEGTTGLGRVADDHVIDLCAACPALPNDMIGLLEAGESAWALAEKATGTRYPLSTVRLEAPVPNPSKYLAIGLNYASHVSEASRLGVRTPTAQVWFNKQISCIIGPYDPIHKPVISDELDYEAEVAFVIGERCRHVKAADAAHLGMWEWDFAASADVPTIWAGPPTICIR